MHANVSDNFSESEYTVINFTISDTCEICMFSSCYAQKIQISQHKMTDYKAYQMNIFCINSSFFHKFSLRTHLDLLQRHSEG